VKKTGTPRTANSNSDSKSSSGKRMSDMAVFRATGKKWNEWFTILDKAGAEKMNHQEIVAILSKKRGVGLWWQQMVTVTYERARGLRKVHQRPDGYSISRSKTVPVPIAKLYRAWVEPRLRGKWLSDSKFTVRKATTKRSMRITWIDGKTTIETMFYPKAAAKSQ